MSGPSTSPRSPARRSTRAKVSSAGRPGSPRSFLMPGAGSSSPPGSVRDRHTPRAASTRRWFASTTPAANEAPRMKGSATSSARQSPVHPQGRHRRPRARDDRRGDLVEVQELAGLQQVLRQPRPDPSPHAPDAEQAPKVGREGKPESYYFPPQLNWTGNNFPHTFMGLEPGTTKDDVRRCLERWNEGDNGILDHLQSLSPQARHRLADPAGRAPRSRLAPHVRAAVGLRRLRHVPVDGRRPARAVGAARQGRPRGQAPRPRLPRRPARLGEERRPHFKAHNYLEPIVHSGGRARATSTSGSSTAPSTASNSSAPAS